MTCGLLLSSSLRHYRNPGVLLRNGGGKKLNSFVGFISSHFTLKRAKFRSKKNTLVPASVLWQYKQGCLFRCTYFYVFDKSNFSAGCGGQQILPKFCGSWDTFKEMEGFWKQNNQLRFLTKLSTDFQFISHPTTLLNYLGHFDTCLLNNLFILRISFLINDIFSNIPSESVFSLRKNISE